MMGAKKTNKESAFLGICDDTVAGFCDVSMIHVGRSSGDLVVIQLNRVYREIDQTKKDNKTITKDFPSPV